MVSDGGNPAVFNDTVLVRVNVVDENDNASVIPSCPESMLEVESDGELPRLVYFVNVSIDILHFY